MTFTLKICGPDGISPCKYFALCSGEIQAVSPPAMLSRVLGLKVAWTVTWTSQVDSERVTRSTWIASNLRTSFSSGFTGHCGQSPFALWAGTVLVERRKATQ